jgi:hypothetical protein
MHGCVKAARGLTPAAFNAMHRDAMHPGATLERSTANTLLEFDGSTRFFKLLLEFFSVVLGGAFLDR